MKVPRPTPREDTVATGLAPGVASPGVASPGVASPGVASPAKQRRQLFSTFGYLVATPGATAILGLGYWAITTRAFSARDVGIAAAAVSTAALLGLVGSLGVGTLLLAEVGSMAPLIRRGALTTGTAIAGSCVALLALATIALSPFLGSSLRAIGSDPVTAALFVAGAIASVAVTTFDSAAIGAHRGPAQLARGILASLLKIGCVAVLVFVGRRTSAGLLFAWAGGLAASLAICNSFLRFERTPSGERSMGARIALARRYGVLSLNHHVLNLSINSVSFVLPVVAALLIMPQQVAYFSTAQVVSQVVLMIPYLLTLTLFVETSSNEQLLHQHLRRTLPLGFAACVAIVVGVEFAAPVALRLFGSAYSEHGTTALRLLVLAGPSYVVKDHYVAIRRAQGRLTHGAKVVALATALETLGGAVGGVFWGLTGLCAGWAVAAALEAFVLLPVVVGVFRHPPVAQQAG